jgi:hypothetical protein
MDKFSFYRLGLLLKMEWAKNKKFFLIFSVLVFVGIIFITGYMNGIKGRYLISEGPQDLSIYFYTTGVLSWLIFSSFSFNEAHKKDTLITFLCLPSTQQEKFFSKLLVYFFAFPVIFLIIFFISIYFSIFIWDTYTLLFVDLEPYYDTNYPQAKPFDYPTLKKIINFMMQERAISVLIWVFGLFTIWPAFSFLSSLHFGKFNIVYSLLFGIGYTFLCVFVLVGFSHILLPEETKGFSISFQNDFLISNEYPLSILIVLMLFHVSPIVFLFTSYLKLKEKEI